jgi:hypothetical protein
MRCPKCGYISFDHLDRCGKCRTDLTSERLRLNLLEVKPNPISLQEIMDRNSQISRKKASREREEVPVIAQRSVVSDTPELTLGEGFSLDDSFSLDLDLTPQRPKGPQKEEGEIELFLEGLELSPSPKKGN